MAYRIEEGTATEWDAVARGLIAFNERAMGVTLIPPEKVTRVAIGEDGAVIGGVLCSYTPILDNLFVDLFWVEESYRGKGIGTALLQSAEEFARERGGILAHLETLDFQAKGFYEKQGYSVFGMLEGPPGHERYFMKKRL